MLLRRSNHANLDGTAAHSFSVVPCPEFDAVAARLQLPRRPSRPGGMPLSVYNPADVPEGVGRGALEGQLLVVITQHRIDVKERLVRGVPNAEAIRDGKTSFAFIRWLLPNRELVFIFA